jgi:hypothetical protein
LCNLHVCDYCSSHFPFPDEYVCFFVSVSIHKSVDG